MTTSSLFLQTPRLLLRPSTPDDAALFLAFCRLPLLHRFLQWQPPRGLAAARSYLVGQARRWERGQGEHWLLFARSAEVAEASGCGAVGVLGAVALHFRGGDADIACAIAPGAWCRGFAGEALACLLPRRGQRVGQWRCHPGNVASIRLAQKLGFNAAGETGGGLLFLLPVAGGDSHP